MFLVVALVLLGAVSANAQPTPSPANQRNAAKTDTPRDQAGTIRGRVTAADTGAPIRRARVSATASGVSVVVVTDEDGRYTLSGLSPRRYKIAASRTPFVAMGFGQRHPNAPAKVDLEFLEEDSWEDPEVLDALRPFATKVTLGPGEHQVTPLLLTMSDRQAGR